MYPSPDTFVLALIGVLCVIFAMGYFHLVRKNGSVMGAMAGAPVEVVGEVVVGTLKDGDTEFKISRVQRQGKPPYLLMRTIKCNLEGWSTSAQTMSADQALRLAALYG